MRQSSYIVVGAIIGLVLGAFVGFFFDSFYTKKSQLKSKQTIQLFVFAAIGTVAGMYVGNKLAVDEAEVERRKKEYEGSLTSSRCGFCSKVFVYSSLEHSTKIYCDECIKQITADYIQKCNEFNKIANGLNDLKQKSAIQKRLDKLESLANSLMIYENIDLAVIQEKPSFILKKVQDYRSSTLT